jgi:hypothetical protein
MKEFFKNKKIYLFLLVFFLIFLFSTARGLEITWPPSPGGTELTSGSTFDVLVKYLYEWGIALGGIVAFFVLVFAGFQYLTSAGDPGKMKEAKDRIFSAFLGLILLLSTWIILNAINPELRGIKTPEQEMKSLEEQVKEMITSANECVEQQTAISDQPVCDLAIVTLTKYENNTTVVSTRIVPRDKPVIIDGYRPVSVVSYFYQKTEGDKCENNCRYCDSQFKCNCSRAGCTWSTSTNKCLPDCDKNCSWCNKESCNSSKKGCAWIDDKCYTNCGVSACGCTLKLATKKTDQFCVPVCTGWWIWTYCWPHCWPTGETCGDQIAKFLGYNNDIPRSIPEGKDINDVKCLLLQK